MTEGGLRPTHQPTTATHQFIQEGYIPQFIQHLERQNKAQKTVIVKYKVLRVMIRNKVNLLDIEEVELFIKKYKNWSYGHKMVAAYAYSDFCKMLKIEWTPPKFRWKETIPFVPTEKEVDALIAGTSKKVSITLQGLKETGFRVGELWDCKWTDLYEEKCTIKCQGEKHGKPREQKISAKLYNRFMTLPKKKRIHFRKEGPRLYKLDV